MTVLSPGIATQETPPFTFAARPAPRWFGVLAIALLALVLPIAYLGDEGEVLAPTIGGLAALAFVLRRRPPALGVIFLALLAAWAVVSFSWSPLAAKQAHPHTYKQFEALTAPKLVLQLVLYCAFVSGVLKLARDQRARALRVLGVTLAAVMAILAADAMLQGHIFGGIVSLTGKHLAPDMARRDAARGCYVTALLVWPLALAGWRRTSPIAPIAIGVLTAVCAVLLGVDAPAAAMILSCAVFLAGRFNARATTWACLIGVGLYFLAAPLVFLPHGAQPPPSLPDDVGKLSWHVRVDIWRFASRLIAHRPVMGYGLDASRAFEPNIPMHPHDAALQLWLELGAPGALLGALFFGWVFYKIARIAKSDPVWAAVACATATVYLLIGAISFGVWQEWWLALGAVAFAVCGLVLQERREAALDPSSPEELTAL